MDSSRLKEENIKKCFKRPWKPKIASNKPINIDSVPIRKSFTPVPVKRKNSKFSNSPSFAISHTSRFEMSTFEKFKFMSRYFKSNRVQRINKAIVSNQNMKQYSPCEKIERLRKSSEKGLGRRIVSRIARFDIISQKKREMERKIEEKFKKLHFRQKKDVKGMQDYSKIYQGLMQLLLNLALVSITKRKIQRAKLIKSRSYKLLRQFAVLARFIGKILYRRHYIMRQLALKKIKKIVPYCRMRYLKTMKSNKTVLVSLFDTLLNSASLKMLINSFKARIIFIQNSMREALQIRRKLYEKLMDLWLEAENDIFSDLISKQSTRKKRESRLSTSKKISLVPSGLKLALLQKQIKELVKVYSLRMRNYQSGQQILADSLISMSWYNSSMVNLQRKRPTSPNILAEITKEVMQDLIHSAMRARTSWRGSVVK